MKLLTYFKLKFEKRKQTNNHDETKRNEKDIHPYVAKHDFKLSERKNKKD